jgi:hypothetical protein
LAPIAVSRLYRRIVNSDAGGMNFFSQHAHRLIGWRSDRNSHVAYRRQQLPDQRTLSRTCVSFHYRHGVISLPLGESKQRVIGRLLPFSKHDACRVMARDGFQIRYFRYLSHDFHLICLSARFCLNCADRGQQIVSIFFVLNFNSL